MTGRLAARRAGTTEASRAASPASMMYPAICRNEKLTAQRHLRPQERPAEVEAEADPECHPDDGAHHAKQHGLHADHPP